MSKQEITNAIKAAAIETMNQGATGMQAAEIIAANFGNAIARLIMVSIAIDNGMIVESKEYLARF